MFCFTFNYSLFALISKSSNVELKKFIYYPMYRLSCTFECTLLKLPPVGPRNRLRLRLVIKDASRPASSSETVHLLRAPVAPKLAGLEIESRGPRRVRVSGWTSSGTR